MATSQGSVRGLLKDKRSPMGWPQRARIAIGVASGLKHLHNDVDPPIVHRDIKTANILVTADDRVRTRWAYITRCL